ncbi:Uncharacterized conserved protein [Litoreibacter janthinus]|uniref:Uncharacterized conserved protein n=1 Tax=Litoreibacter janthinus TaxID=670154 RepID=A0A1I6H0M7_9RHOB|nr:Uncharacterized conserved protein [Litoreibacter janthinus]
MARQVSAVGLSLAIVGLLYHKTAAIDVAAVFEVFQTFSFDTWILSAIFTGISLAAVGCYDVLAARYLQLDLPDTHAHSVGWRATAIAQAVGFGLFSGSLVRWKLHANQPEFTLWLATKMTGIVTACFLGGWVIVASAAGLVAPNIPPQIWWLSLLCLWIAICVAAFSFSAAAQTVRLLPPIRLISRATIVTLIDTCAASFVIFVFIPDGYVPFLTLYSVFLLAYFAGLISGVPAGIGPFELCFLALLPNVEPTALLAALLAYRVIYFAAPALIALAPQRRRANPMPDVEPDALDYISGAEPAEMSLLTQGQLHQIANPYGRSKSLGRRTCNTEILFRDPFGGDPIGFLVARLRLARRAFRGLLIYKASSQTAQAARAIGLSAHQIGSEAVLNPSAFTLNTPSRAKLRRKLRSSAKEGVHTVPNAPQMSKLHKIDRDWQAKNGPARGFSVGRFGKEIVSTQRVFTAYQDERPVAFVTFHYSKDRWVLDLVRSGRNCPDGAIYTLIAAAIDAAREQGVGTLSLCSAPLHLSDTPKTWVEYILRITFQRSKASRGLHQFKSYFDPNWVPQFIVADSIFTLISGGIELYNLIHARQRQNTGDPIPAHDHYDDYQFDSYALACEEAR